MSDISPSYVDFAYRQPELPVGGNLSGRPSIFRKLSEYGLMPVVSFDAEGSFGAPGELQVARLDVVQGIEQTKPLGAIAVSEVAVVVNRIGRSVKYERLPEGTTLPPMVNENATRSLVWRKHRADQRVLSPILGQRDMHIPTLLLGKMVDIGDFMTENPASAYIVKPDSGTNSEGVQLVEATNLAQVVASPETTDKLHVLQPAYDFSVPFPRALKPYDYASQEAFEGWAGSAMNKELRVYGMHSPAGTEVFPVARVTTNGQDNWFFADPDSVPEAVLTGARDVITAAAKQTEAQALLGTVDFGYGAVRGSGQAPGWRAIEINGRAPYTVGYDKHPMVAEHLRVMFAGMLYQTALANQGSVVS